MKRRTVTNTWPLLETFFSWLSSHQPTKLVTSTFPNLSSPDFLCSCHPSGLISNITSSNGPLSKIVPFPNHSLIILFTSFIAFIISEILFKNLLIMFLPYKYMNVSSCSLSSTYRSVLSIQ